MFLVVVICAVRKRQRIALNGDRHTIFRLDKLAPPRPLSTISFQCKRHRSCAPHPELQFLQPQAIAPRSPLG